MNNPAGSRNIDLFSNPTANGLTICEANGGGVSVDLFSDLDGRGLNVYDGSYEDKKISIVYAEQQGPFLHMKGRNGTQVFLNSDNPSSGMSEISLIKGIAGPNETGTRIFLMDNFWGTAIMDDGILKGSWAVNEGVSTAFYLDNDDGARLLLMNDNNAGPVVMLTDEDKDIVWDAP